MPRGDSDMIFLMLDEIAVERDRCQKEGGDKPVATCR